MNYEIKITAINDFGSAASAAVIISKALNLDSLLIETQEGFSVVAGKESRVADLMRIYQLEYENKKLKNSIKK